ncbi:MAG: SDR family NAD(P)-dependent oxidoreductase [Variovorax sp.]|nr:SDR family NAD(P)-dependent oxidoreductase [Variovorax sp.]
MDEWRQQLQQEVLRIGVEDEATTGGTHLVAVLAVANDAIRIHATGKHFAPIDGHECRIAAGAVGLAARQEVEIAGVQIQRRLAVLGPKPERAFQNAGELDVTARVDDWDAMIDIDIKGVLYGIAAALPIFRKQGAGHFVNVASTAAHRIVPGMAVYAGTKFAVRAISEGLRQEAGTALRVTVISPGMTRTGFADSMTSPELKAQTQSTMEEMGIPPDAIARAIAFAIEQPSDVDVGEIIVRPTAQS